MKKDGFHLIMLFIIFILLVIDILDAPKNTNEDVFLMTQEALNRQDEYIYVIYEMEKDIAYLRQHVPWDDTTYDDSCLSIYEDDIAVVINECRLIYEDTYEHEKP